MTATGLDGTRSRFVSPLVVAGVGYSAVWIVGLVIAPSGVDVHSSGRDILDSYAGSRGAGLTQAVLVHGLAGIALPVVISAIAVRHRRPGAVRSAGYAAVALSLVQCVLELVLFLGAVPDEDAGAAHSLYATVSRLDGAKMLALAALAVLALSGSGALFRRWLVIVGWALAVAITVSGIGYLFLLGGLASAAFVSLPLLLIWVTGSALTITRRAA